jgi:RNA polymerase primary sigma factor
MVSNAEIINIFRDVDSENKIAKNEIVRKAAFLVYKNSKKYKKFANYEDLVQEGFLGLVRAVNKFDVTRFSNFFSYAEQWVIHYIRKAASRFDVVYDPNKVRVIYMEPNENEVDLENTPENHFFAKERNKILRETLEKFSPRERSVVKRMFGIDRPPETLREVGVQFNISHERIRQIKNSALSKFRKTLPDICGEF